jgi:hypothetical protein
MKMTRSELANKISSDLDCTSKVWEKGDKVRVYLSHRGKDYGFVEIATKGVEFNLSGYANNTTVVLSANQLKASKLSQNHSVSR